MMRTLLQRLEEATGTAVALTAILGGGFAYRVGSGPKFYVAIGDEAAWFKRMGLDPKATMRALQKQADVTVTVADDGALQREMETIANTRKFRAALDGLGLSPEQAHAVRTAFEQTEQTFKVVAERSKRGFLEVANYALGRRDRKPHGVDLDKAWDALKGLFGERRA